MWQTIESLERERENLANQARTSILVSVVMETDKSNILSDY